MTEFKIGVDVMGGDYAPEAAVMGAIQAIQEIGETSRLVLFGDKPQIEAIFSRENVSLEVVDIVHTTQVIEMGDKSVHAFIGKPDSSMAVGFKYLKGGLIDGFASAGSTGGMMVGCMHAIKLMQGIIRPAISTIVPTLSQGGSSLLLDVGLNIDSKPDVLCQYGLIGSIYAKSVLKIDNPRVALLNIGEEREKGNLVTKATYELMDQAEEFNFVGNVEAKYLCTGKIADVIVCDGFIGNTLLKQYEGFYEMTRSMGIESEFIDRMNYESIGGTPVLGVNAAVVIGHGCSTARAIKNMILQTERTVHSRFVSKLREAFGND
ncbi:MAG: phosphate--acyl-ACP acyltransferase [Rikenellaceae bacterium]